jgi:hypothetical protein
VDISNTVCSAELTSDKKLELNILVNKHSLLQKKSSLVLNKYVKETSNEKSYAFTRQPVKAKQAKNAKLSLERQLHDLKEEINLLEEEISNIDSTLLSQLAKSK